MDKYEISASDDVIVDSEDLERIMSALQIVPEEYRLVFNLYVVDGYKHKEISKMLNITEQNSMVRLTRAKEMIKLVLSVGLVKKNSTLKTQHSKLI